MSKLYIQKKSVSELPKATGSISDTLNVEDKVTNAPSINLVTKLSGIPEEGIIAYEGDDIPEGYEETTNPITAIADILFPIGRGFLDFTDTDYSNWLGLTWERELVGMTPIGKDANDTDFATVGAKGGEKTHTLSESELPILTGEIWMHSSNTATNISDATGKLSGILKCEGKYRDGGTLGSLSTIQSFGGIKLNIGGGQEHNNLPPYQVVSYWKRVAPKTMISFSIYGITYQAEEGMTFGEWLNSSYNTDGWTYYSESITTVYNPAGNLSEKFDIVSYVQIEDIIEDGKTYTYYTEK